MIQFSGWPFCTFIFDRNSYSEELKKFQISEVDFEAEEAEVT
ncbi:hypothetical protein RKLH11_4180 [Rhodobacteraceae bacterium KLH11]|nr:hypothetical protein RKLH11_4180 [Rhodobacteraceae bacterium KLH11]